MLGKFGAVFADSTGDMLILKSGVPACPMIVLFGVKLIVNRQLLPIAPVTFTVQFTEQRCALFKKALQV